MLRKPVPTGVVIGAFRAQRVRRMLSSTASGSGVPVRCHHVDARLLHVPVDLHAGGVDASPGGLGQFGSHAVAGDQRHFISHFVSSLLNRARLTGSFSSAAKRPSLAGTIGKINRGGSAAHGEPAHRIHPLGASFRARLASYGEKGVSNAEKRESQCRPLRL